VIFAQLFEPVSSTYTYLLGCAETGLAILVDPVMPAWQRDLAEVRSRGLTLAYTVDTHIHADHITSALQLRREAGSRIANAAADGLACTDVGLAEGVPLQAGSIRLEPLHTPGHTEHHLSLVCGDRVFSGDALLIDGCGRTDFQNGDARTLYDSVRRKLFALPGETRVFPAHDYQGRLESTIARERETNSRLGGGRTVEEFVAIMAGLGLPYPAFIDHAVPGNRLCGVCPDDLPDDLAKYCAPMQQSRQG